MKLKPECVRAVLLTLEEKLVITDDLRSEPINIFIFLGMVTDFQKPDVLYTVQKLNEGGYISASFQYANDEIYYGAIDSITYQGHQFLESVRNEDTWHKILDIFKGTGSFTLDNAMDIAKEITKSVIKQKLGLNS